MNRNETFRYNYSAAENKEIREIRKRYLECGESKFEELKRLDSTVQSAGTVEALCTGIGGALAFGLGLCLAMQVIGGGALVAVLGVLLSVVGISGMLAAYPLRRRIYESIKKKHTARIIELANELSNEKNKN